VLPSIKKAAVDYVGRMCLGDDDAGAKLQRDRQYRPGKMSLWCTSQKGLGNHLDPEENSTGPEARGVETSVVHVRNRKKGG